jgi:hypothetical protein
MANNMEFVSAFSYAGNNAGAPPRAEQQVNEWRRNSWMLEMERALLAATEVTAAPELSPSLLAGMGRDGVGAAASEQILPALAAQGTVAARVVTPTISLVTSPATSQVTSALATKVASSANPVRQAGTATLSDANVAFEGAGNVSSSTALNNDPVSIDAQDSLDNQDSLDKQDSLDANQDSLESAQQISAQQMIPWFNPYQSGQMSAQMGSMYFGAGSQAQLNEMGLNPALSALRTDAAGLSMLQSRLAVVDQASGRAILPGAAEMGADLAKGADALDDGLTEDVADGTRFMARSTASSKAMQAAQDAYAKRQLHLYPGADGVQAWIRDVDLNQIQAQAVALALRQELNGSGLKLKTLTLNGRKLELPEIDLSLMPVTQPDDKNQ